MDFENIKKTLKSEFIGINRQIDTIVDIVKPWYYNPELYDSPCIINLWGMTGHGKTSLVDRLIDLMGEGHNRMYMNCHAMIGEASYFIDQFVDDNFTNTRTNKFVIFDDFQYVRTIDEDGNENPSSSLSSMWTLMDTGVIREAFSQSNFKKIQDFLNIFDAMESPDDVKDGHIVDLRKYIPVKYINNPLISVFNLTSLSKNKKNKSQTNVYNCFMEDDAMSTVVYIARSLGFEDCEDCIDFINARRGWNAFEWRDFFKKLLDDMKKGRTKDLHNSIIFVIGNIDEAYYGTSKQVNPEMNADQLHEITKRINIVDIKKGLQTRFRNEQVARLGNTHIIYPSFDCASYKAIINKLLDKYAMKFLEVTGTLVEFDDLIRKCIYDEGVFPAQGVRPLLSTIVDIIKTNAPKAVDTFHSKGINIIPKLHFSFDINCKSVIITMLDESDNNVDTVKIPVFLRVKDSYKDNKETIANTSVHESGHFVIYKYLTGNSPVKVVSKSLEHSCLGYMMEKFDEGVSSYERMKHEIAVCLGGYTAETIVFRENRRSSGASSDIENATSVAVSMLHEWGFGLQGPVRIAQSNTPDSEFAVLLTENERAKENEHIKAILVEQYEYDKNLLENNDVLRECFVTAFNRLNDKGELSEEDIKEISDKIETAPGYCPISTTYYSDALKAFK